MTDIDRSHIPFTLQSRRTLHVAASVKYLVGRHGDRQDGSNRGEYDNLADAIRHAERIITPHHYSFVVERVIWEDGGCTPETVWCSRGGLRRSWVESRHGQGVLRFGAGFYLESGGFNPNVKVS